MSQVRKVYQVECEVRMYRMVEVVAADRYEAAARAEEAVAAAVFDPAGKELFVTARSAQVVATQEVAEKLPQTE